jgi:hypothetical protein
MLARHPSSSIFANFLSWITLATSSSTVADPRLLTQMVFVDVASAADLAVPGGGKEPDGGLLQTGPRLQICPRASVRPRFGWPVLIDAF